MKLFVLLALIASGAASTWASPRLAKPGSTHPSFPLDAFAKPAYKLLFLDDDPISNQTAIDILWKASELTSDDSGSSSLKEYDTSEYEGSESYRPITAQAFLHRSGPDSLHVCTLAVPQVSQDILQLDELEVQSRRHTVLKRALKLLEPLKEQCLFYTLDWFTYSLCYGDAIKQFHAQPGTGGIGKAPEIDRNEKSYVLGRWRDSINTVRGTPPERKTVSSGQDDMQSVNTNQEDGSELMELVHFSSLDGSTSEQGRAEIANQASVEGHGRYISQLWMDGTLCDINNEQRATEVQFHCSNTPAGDRISLIKEVTTCNYVVVVETRRLCEEPALAQKDAGEQKVHCRPVVSDAELEESRLRKLEKAKTTLLESHDDASEYTKNEDASSTKSDSITPTSDTNAKRLSDGNLPISVQTILEKLGMSHEDAEAQIEKVELVVGYDEQGNFIIDPQNDQLPPGLANFLGQSKSSREQEDLEESEHITTGSGSDTREKWQKISEKIQETQNNHDQNGRMQGSPNNGQEHRKGKQKEERRIDPSTQRRNQAQRSKLMVREAEPFAQRVERFYKAQEGKKSDNRHNDNKKSSKKDRHDEL